MPTRDDGYKVGLTVIWAIGVGSVFDGDFFGWQYLLYGGVISGITAILFTAIFYWAYAAVITELAARYRAAGGAFDFVRHAIGIRAAAIMAILSYFKLVLSIASMAIAVSSYLIHAGLPAKGRPFYWFVSYFLFTLLDCMGMKASSQINILVTGICVVILIFYSMLATATFNIENLTNSGLSTDGILGFFKGLPFALYLFDGFEELPLVMSYTINPYVNIPKGLSYSWYTISFLSLLVFISGSGSAPSEQIILSPAPLMICINKIFGRNSPISHLLSVFMVVGLLVNFFAFIMFTSRQVAAIAEAGLIPQFLAYRHPEHGAPIYASIVSSSIGLTFCCLFTYIFGTQSTQFLLITASLIPAIIGYTLLLQCIIIIRRMENIKNKGQSLSRRQNQRLGFDPGPLRFYYNSTGARIAQVMCLIFCIGLMILCYLDRDCLNGLIIIVVAGVFIYGAMSFNMARYQIRSSYVIMLHGKVVYGAINANDSFSQPITSRTHQNPSNLMTSSSSATRISGYGITTKEVFPQPPQRKQQF